MGADRIELNNELGSTLELNAEGTVIELVYRMGPVTIEGPGGGGNWFSFDFTVPAEDEFGDDYKIILGFPETGYVCVDVDDLPFTDKVVFKVFDHTHGVELRDWRGFDWLAGVFAGSALVGSDLTISGTWESE